MFALLTNKAIAWPDGGTVQIRKLSAHEFDHAMELYREGKGYDADTYAIETAVLSWSFDVPRDEGWSGLLAFDGREWLVKEILNFTRPGTLSDAPQESEVSGGAPKNSAGPSSDTSTATGPVPASGG